MNKTYHALSAFEQVELQQRVEQLEKENKELRDNQNVAKFKSIEEWNEWWISSRENKC